MRKSDREIHDMQTIRDILDEAEFISVAINTEDCPYVVPLSFGYKEDKGQITLYFHCAKEGRKLELLARDNRVGVEIALSHGYVRHGSSATADYRSIIGTGRAVPLSGQEALDALDLLLAHCHIDDMDAQACVALGAVRVYQIVLEQYCGKKRF